MPGPSADAVDSRSRDFHISDDGYNWGPDEWPAPRLKPDDHSNAYRVRPGVRPRTSELFDAYAFLRHEPNSPMVHHVSVDARGFASLEDAGMLHDAGRILFTEAGVLPVRSRVGRGGSLHRGQQLTSPNGRYLLILQSDGNLVLYPKGRPAIWDSATVGRGVSAIMQGDGNFVVYDAQNRPVWDAGSQGNPGAYLVLQDDGNAVVYSPQNRPLWNADTAGGVKHEHSSSIFSKIGGAVSSVGSAIGHAASDVAKAAAPLASVVRTVAPFAQTALSFVPGVGTVVNGAIAAGSALAQGKNITDALIDTASAAIPGGPLAKQAFQTGVAIVKGENVTTAALDAVRNQLPGGLAAKAAFDTAVALAHGQSIQQAALAGGTQIAQSALDTARSQGMSFLDQLSPLATRAFSSVGPGLRNTVGSALPSLLPHEVNKIAQALLNRPELRSLPISELARRMNVTERDAREGLASVVQSIARAGGSKLPGLAPAQALANRLPSRTSFDHAIAAYASRARPPVFTHNALRMLGARGFNDAGALPPTIQQGSTGAAVKQWQAIIGVTVDGAFGPKTKAATIVWQAAHGLVADGIVGPKTWTAALGSASPAPSSSAPVPMPALPGAPAPALPAAPPVVVATLANQLPMLRVGSTGPAVMKWQQIVGVKADGIFGPQTQAATKAWQAAHGLVADGIVGPKTWTAAMNAPAASSAPPPVALPLPIPTTPVTVATPVGPIAIPIPTVPAPQPDQGVSLPPSVTTFPVPPIVPGTTPPFIPGQVSTVQTPDGPVTATTDRTGQTVTVTEPTITGSAPSSGGAGAVGALLVLGTLIAVGSSGRKGFL